MKKIILLAFIILAGCAVSVKESYKNPSYQGKINKLAITWTMPKKISIEITKFAQGYTPKIEPRDIASAQKEISTHLANLQKNSPGLFTKKFEKNGVEVSNSGENVIILEITPKSTVEAVCNSTPCRAWANIVLTLKDQNINQTIWTGTLRVGAALPYYGKDSYGENKLITPDSTVDFVDKVINELIDAKLIANR